VKSWFQSLLLSNSTCTATPRQEQQRQQQQQWETNHHQRQPQPPSHHATASNGGGGDGGGVAAPKLDDLLAMMDSFAMAPGGDHAAPAPSPVYTSNGGASHTKSHKSKPGSFSKNKAAVAAAAAAADEDDEFTRRREQSARDRAYEKAGHNKNNHKTGGYKNNDDNNDASHHALTISHCTSSASAGAQGMGSGSGDFSERDFRKSGKKMCIHWAKKGKCSHGGDRQIMPRGNLPKITCSDAGQMTQNTSKVPKNNTLLMLVKVPKIPPKYPK
jgi:hypothetical protein